VTPNTQNFSIDHNGKLVWENGSTDMALERSAANTLKVLGNMVAEAVNAALPGLVVRGAAAQAGDLLSLRNSSDTALAKVTNAGVFSAANILVGAGSPEGVATANPGSIFLRTDSDGTAASLGFYVKESGTGNTGWAQAAAYNPAITPLPTGVALPWIRGTVPTGFAALVGGNISRTGDNAALFDLWGTAFGVGDGATTFGIPDMRGRNPIAVLGSSANFGSLNIYGGSETAVAPLVTHGHTVNQSNYTHSHGGSVTTNTTGSHQHDYYPAEGIGSGYFVMQLASAGGSVATTPGPYTATNVFPSVASTRGSGNHYHTAGIAGDTHGHNVSVNNAGSSDGTHNNVQPFFTVANWIVKL
jgi:microcystin-dependent protein